MIPDISPHNRSASDFSIPPRLKRGAFDALVPTRSSQMSAGNDTRSDWEETLHRPVVLFLPRRVHRAHTTGVNPYAGATSAVATQMMLARRTQLRHPDRSSVMKRRTADGRPSSADGMQPATKSWMDPPVSPSAPIGTNFT